MRPSKMLVRAGTKREVIGVVELRFREVKISHIRASEARDLE